MKRLQEHASDQHTGESEIIRVSVRFLIPFIQLFGLYVIAHGHYSPGGGFQGGVILGASFILMAVAFDLKNSLERFREKVNGILGNVGVLIYVGTGFVCALLGGLFLDYAALAKVIPMEAAGWRSLGILIVEIGVGITVMSIMASLYWDLSSGGEMDEGL